MWLSQRGYRAIQPHDHRTIASAESPKMQVEEPIHSRGYLNPVHDGCPSQSCNYYNAERALAVTPARKLRERTPRIGRLTAAASRCSQPIVAGPNAACSAQLPDHSGSTGHRMRSVASVLLSRALGQDRPVPSYPSSHLPPTCAAVSWPVSERAKLPC